MHGAVQPKSFDAKINPEFTDIDEFFLNFGVKEVEIRLGVEEVGIVTVCAVSVPYLAAVHRIVHAFGGGYIVIQVFRVAFHGFDEPRMLVGGMVQNHIENDFDAFFFGFFDQILEIIQGAVLWVDIVIIGYFKPW